MGQLSYKGAAQGHTNIRISTLSQGIQRMPEIAGGLHGCLTQGGGQDFLLLQLESRDTA